MINAPRATMPMSASYVDFDMQKDIFETNMANFIGL